MIKIKYYLQRITIVCLALQLSTAIVYSQKVYFIDGYHGGVYGHYPKQYTRFITNQLDNNPNWKINLEIEPETWDSVQANEPENYAAFKKYFEDQSVNGRLEYVNPSYGQGYLFNINGESIIRQFYYGIKKLKAHFPSAVFNSYSSEEPCFTSALPQILTSFGFSYASLKNPNTCWGGYTRAFGGETINWVGPDGTKLMTVPRYGIEALKSGSTWQTIASTNSANYLNAAFAAGITNPIGMCLQDAGWKNGPWLGQKPDGYYQTWRNYFKNIATKPQQDWNFSQEDVQVSLVWGAQVMQKIAKQIRVSENKIVAAEKMVALAKIYKETTWPTAAFDEAWRGILLSQHHDCWIVPYNGSRGNTWIDKVQTWTSNADKIADEAIQNASSVLTRNDASKNNYFIRVFNTLGNARNEFVEAVLPTGFNQQEIIVLDKNNAEIPSQIIEKEGLKTIVFKAMVPSIGYATYQLKAGKQKQQIGNLIQLQKDGNYKIETDFYTIIIDVAKGGIIKSLIAKKLNNKQFVDTANKKSFNELSGSFYKDSSYFSSTESPAIVTVAEDGAACTRIKINGVINKNPFTQTITLFKNQPIINLNVKIDWIGNPGIGNDYKQMNGYKSEDYHKAFYDDSKKLQTLFPLNLDHQKVYKNAPFDVTESKLDNTFFNTWDSIKNNVILNWVDVTDGSGDYGLAMFTNHTTSYAHAQDFPLALTTAYSGVGLWGRNYSITGPTEINYAILPHAGRWDKNNVWAENTAWNNPMMAIVFQSENLGKNPEKSLVAFSGKGLETTAVLMEGNDLLIRLFNAQNSSNNQKITVDGTAESIDFVELDGNLRQHLVSAKTKTKQTMVNINIPKFGIRTIRLHNFKTSTF